MRQTFLDNPVLTDLILVRGALSPLAERLGARATKRAIVAMINGGLDEQTARDTYAAVSELVQGSVLRARLQSRQTSADNTPQDGERGFELLLSSLLDAVSRQTAD